jgi:hypothetical protein
MLGRIADRSGALLERGVPAGGLLERGAKPSAHPLGEPDDSGALLERRSFLLRVAVVGSALAIAPMRYLLYPGTALAAVVGPWDCPTGRCAEGYTEFCCEINEGSVNTCADQGVRYYVDCNALPGHPFPGGCRCGNNNCDNRRVACNVFRYGQCNTHIEGTTAVVCRMILCENPARVSELHCSAAIAIDDATCGHEAPCLEPAARQLVGAGGV